MLAAVHWHHRLVGNAWAAASIGSASKEFFLRSCKEILGKNMSSLMILSRATSIVSSVQIAVS